MKKSPAVTPWIYRGTWALIFAFFGWSFGDTYGSSRGHKEGIRAAEGACRDEIVVVNNGGQCSHHDQRSSIAWSGASLGLHCTCAKASDHFWPFN